MGIVDQLTGDVLRDARQADIQARAEEIGAVREVEVDLGVDCEVGRQGNLLLAGGEPDGAFEAGFAV